MRNIDRSLVEAPRSLSSPAARQARRDIEQILILPEGQRRQRRVPFNFDLQRDGGVLNSLFKLFDGKCAYCENSIISQDTAVVSHFRPTQAAGGLDASTNNSEHHYSWLAYEWGNLYLACQNCSRSKANFFPVRGGRAALLTSLDEVRESEAAILLDPCFDQPEKHLEFRWNGTCVSRTQRGSITINILALNRSSLVASRLKVFVEFLSRLRAMQTSPAPIALLSDTSEYVGALISLTGRLAEDLGERSGHDIRSSDAVEMIHEAISNATDQEIIEAFEAAEAESHRLPEDIVSTARTSTMVVDSPTAIASSHRAVSRYEAFGIQSVEINSFKIVDELKFELNELRESKVGSACLMLLGENACGKSTVLEAIALALAGAEEASKIIITPSEYLRRVGENWTLTDIQPVSVKVRLYGSENPAEFLIDPVRQKVEGTSSASTLVFGYGPRRYFVKGRRKDRGPLSSLFDPLATIPDPINWLQRQRNAKFLAIARPMREVLSLHNEDELIYDEERGICIVVNGQAIPLLRMSDGYKSLFAMLVDLMRRLLDYWDNLEVAKAVVLIDEIETHLHPRWKMRILSSLRQALPYVTFIVTTHDPLCLRGMEDGEIEVLRRGKDQRVEKLEDLPSIKGLRADQILTSDFFGLFSTADPETEAKLALYADAISASDDRQPSEGPNDVADIQTSLAKTIIGSESPSGQIVEQAMKEYLQARESAPPRKMTEARRRAVQEVLNALNSLPTK